MTGPILDRINIDANGSKVSCIIKHDNKLEEYTVEQVMSLLNNNCYIKNAAIVNGELTCYSTNGHFKDLTGDKINDWYVIDYLGHKYWRCMCSCGNIRAVAASSLLEGRTLSCGHNVLAKRDLTGQTIKGWYVDSYAGNKRWNCTCIKCGQKKEILTDGLYYGTCKECSCQYHSYNFIDLTGSVFGHWTVLKFAGTRPVGDKGIMQTYWTCQCDCDKHTISDVQAYSLLSGRSTNCGCVQHIVSDPEIELHDYVKTLTNNVIFNDRTILKGKELDVYLPDIKLAIEYNGSYWHSSEMKEKNYHLDKTLQCEKLGIQLIHIFDYEWEDDRKCLLLKELIKNKVLQPKNVIGARQAEIRTVEIAEERDFLNAYHLQGSINSKVAYGLYYNNELIELMSFGTPRYAKEADTEILRLCTKMNWAVMGGAEKLFKHYITQRKNETIVSYCNVAKFSGEVYEKLGMQFVSLSSPNYVYVSNTGKKSLSRQQCMKSILIEKGWGTADMTEEQIMKNHGYVKVYDCGNKKYIHRA